MTDLWRLNATDLAARIRGKQVSATEAAKDALARLAAVNPKINAVVDHRPEETLADAARNLLRLSQARDAGRAPASLTRELRLFPPRDRLYLDALRRLDTASLRQAVQEAAGVDRIIKGLVAADPWQAMVPLVGRLAGAPVLAAPR